MPVIEPTIRPPAEAYSFLLQVTIGCSAQACAFCGAYGQKKFRIKEWNEIEQDIEKGARRYPDTRRVFLLDGDALVLSNEKLIRILKKLHAVFPHLSRVSSYANGFTLATKHPEELHELYAHKLSLVYMGLESGSQKVLDSVHKKATVEEMVNGVRAVQLAGMKSSIIVLLGLGGKRLSAVHIKETARALNAMQPRLLSFLSLMLIPGTPLYEARKKGTFIELNAKEMLFESAEIIKQLTLQHTVFRSNHASNYLPLEGRLPQDKERLLKLHDDALNGNIQLTPELFRGL